MKDELIKQFVEHIAKGCREEQSEDCGVECTYNDACVCWKPILSDLVDIVLTADYVQLAKDQSLPDMPEVDLRHDFTPFGWYEQAQQDMIKAGWKKVYCD